MITNRWHVGFTPTELPSPSRPWPFVAERPADWEGWLRRAEVMPGTPFLVSPTLDELTQQRSPALAGPDPVAAAGRFEKIQRENAELRRAKLELTEHLDLAIANIQRLTLDNHYLRQQLHAATKVTHINVRSRG
jgi:hypothetical protein